jgi:hypothetical protein
MAAIQHFIYFFADCKNLSIFAKIYWAKIYWLNKLQCKMQQIKKFACSWSSKIGGRNTESKLYPPYRRTWKTNTDKVSRRKM